MTNKLYVVTFDGYCEDYGAYIYLLGVYDTYLKASEAIEKAVEESENMLDPNVFKISECEINKSFDIKRMDDEFFPEVVTDINLGGFGE